MSDVERRTVWDLLPRLLQELCSGHPGYVVEAYGYDYPNGYRAWFCKSCYPHEALQAKAREFRAQGLIP